MADSNLDKSRLTPFESITIAMKEKTDSSSPYMDLKKPSGAYRKPGDNLFVPVYLNAEDSDDEKVVGRCVTSNEKKYSQGTPIVGVALESFRFDEIPTRVLVQGIVPMQVFQKVTAGSLVTPAKDGDNYTDMIKTAAKDDWAFGIALSQGSAKGDWIAVMLCHGQKLKS